jgi:uncharacterized protein
MDESAHGSAGDFSAVPLFPLPGLVLLPHAVLPLHIFEDRYRAMTADALAGDQQIAMALLRPGWEKDYYARPLIEPVVCVGRIMSWEKLADGKYNFLLQGTARARVVREREDGAYRVAQLARIEETSIMELDLVDYRERLTHVFSHGALAETPVGRQFSQLLMTPMPTDHVADVLAFNLIESVELKLALLGDGDVRRRVGRIVAAIEQVRPMLEAAAMRTTRDSASN